MRYFPSYVPSSSWIVVKTSRERNRSCFPDCCFPDWDGEVWSIIVEKDELKTGSFISQMIRCTCFAFAEQELCILEVSLSCQHATERISLGLEALRYSGTLVHLLTVLGVSHTNYKF